MGNCTRFKFSQQTAQGLFNNNFIFFLQLHANNFVHESFKFMLNHMPKVSTHAQNVNSKKKMHKRVQIIFLISVESQPFNWTGGQTFPYPRSIVQI